MINAANLISILNLSYYICLATGFFTLIIGASAVLKPEFMSTKFGISAKGSTLPYVMSTGIRDVFIGLVILILYYRQEWTAQGYVHLCLGIVAISDFLVVQKHGDKKTSFVHLFSAIAVIIYGGWLIYNH